VILLDSNILIEILKGNEKTIQKIESLHTALEKELTLFTYNTKDFKYINHITLL